MFDHAVHVLTVSDRAFAGDYADTAGPRAVQLLQAAHPAAQISNTVVADGIDAVQRGISHARAGGARVVITLGGTGVAPRDVTPEASASLIGRNLPGIAEAIRRAGSASTPMSAVSRGLAGVIEADGTSAEPTLLVNLAGSLDAAEVGCAVLNPLIAHIVAQMDGAAKGNAGHSKAGH